MTELAMDFLPRDGRQFGSLGEALASWARKRWPRDTAKHIAKAWDVDPSTAVNITKGHGSERSLSKAVRAEGWPLIVALGEAMTGESYGDFLQGVVDEQERARERAKERRDHFRNLEKRAAELVSVGGWARDRQSV